MPEINELYIGTKVIAARRMGEHEFLALKGKDSEIPVRLDREGYLVKYPDGYTSWSPRDVFEAAYRLVSNDELKMLGMVSRPCIAIRILRDFLAKEV